MTLLKKQFLLKRIFIYLLFSTSTTILYAQNIDLGAMKGKVKDKLKDKKYISVTGGINASTTYSKSTAGGGRDPLTYLLSANASVSLWGLVNIPLSFTLTNLGKTYGYQFPTLPTRLSLHPRYKWITTHIGQFTSNHSPYAMNGVPMTGFGIDLSPKGSFKYSAYYGRLQRAVQYEPNGNRNTLPFYKRMGYGGKISYESGKRKLATSIFYGKDELTSLLLKPDSLQIYPQQNIAISNELSFPLAKSLLLTVEYGISVLTRDVRAPKYTDSSSKNWLLQTLGGKQSSNIYHAIKSQINYTIGSTSIGAGYERIDPGYQTLGSAYSNNDLRNITVNFAQALFNSKVNLSGNIGQQRDDLDGTKSGNLVRTVMAYNININPSPRITTTVTYSNFQTFTNVKPQFQYINQLTQFDNLDTLNFKQLSQSASANVNYILDTSKEKPKSFNLNFSLQDAYDQQAGKVTKGNSSQFYNFSGAYIRTNMKKGQTINAALNATYNTIGTNKIITLGPTITYNKQLFKNKVILGSSLSYNQNMSNGSVQSKVSAMRMNMGYNIKKVHNFTLNGAFMMRSGGNQQSIYDFTTTLAYSYNFAYPKQKKLSDSK